MPERDEERFLQDVAAAARPVAPASPDLDTRIMAAVHRAARPRWRGALAWFIAPRTVRVSPVAVFATVAGVIVAGLLLSPGLRSFRPTAGAVAVSPVADSLATMRFVLVAREAVTVALVGDFNQWSPEATPLRPTGADGVWIVDVRIAPGRHEYAFVVDGERWVADPSAPRAPAADFGTPNSVITVLPEIS